MQIIQFMRIESEANVKEIFYASMNASSGARHISFGVGVSKSAHHIYTV